MRLIETVGFPLLGACVMLLSTACSLPQSIEQSPPRIDGTSEESVRRTFEVVHQTVPAAQRLKLIEAMNLIKDAEEAKLANFEPLQAAKILRAALHNKTAAQLMTEAEVVIREKVSAEKGRQQRMTVKPLPHGERTNSSALACAAILSTTIEPARPPESELFRVSENSFLRPDNELETLFDFDRLEGSSAVGTDKIALEVEGRSLYFVTAAAVESGMARSAPMQIARHDEDALVAFELGEGPLGFTASSFLLNKTNGYAVWTKSRPHLIIRKAPDTQSLYLHCR